jgi:hypothetical protein
MKDDDLFRHSEPLVLVGGPDDGMEFEFAGQVGNYIEVPNVGMVAQQRGNGCVRYASTERYYRGGLAWSGRRQCIWERTNAER